MQYMLVKINPDTRFTEADRDKMYSRPVTSKSEYEKLSTPSGHGFHECMNFMPQRDGLLYLYFPKPSRPAKNKVANGNDFTIFLCTSGDPIKIIGVHAGVKFRKEDGAGETKIQAPKGIEKFFHIATADPSLSALFEFPVPIDISAGRHARKLKKWGAGRRYIDRSHARNILSDASINRSTKITFDNNWKIHEERLRRIYDQLFVDTDIVDPVLVSAPETGNPLAAADEGALKYGLHARFERSSKLIAEFKRNPLNMTCCVCGFSFENQYGELGANYIEAHHNVPLSLLRAERKTKPSELSPVCSNCHRMLHRKSGTLTIEELKIRLDHAKKKNRRNKN
jgi:hypothetical protein